MTITEELREVRSDLARLLHRVDRLYQRSLDGRGSLTPADVRELSMAKAIVWILEDSGETMSPLQIWKALGIIGRQDRKDSVSVSTYDLAKAGRIEQVGRGLYRRNSRD